MPFGGTNTPEFGAKPVTETDGNPPARNPWNPARTPGGSSGGSAAAVAAGVVPLAGASDGGGSIRIPASHCALFGLKPGRGRTPAGPMTLDAIHGAAVQHALTRSVRDSAALLDATAGLEPGAAVSAPPQARPYLDELERDPAPLRIAFATRSPLGSPVHPECVRAVEETASLLESLGHHVEPGEPQLDGRQLGADFLTVWFGRMAADVAALRARTGAGRAGFDRDTLALARLGHTLHAGEYVAAHDRWAGYAMALAEFHARHDLLLIPAVAEPPVGIVCRPRSA